MAAIIGIANSLVGSFLSAAGYAAIKRANNEVMKKPHLVCQYSTISLQPLAHPTFVDLTQGRANRQNIFVLGYLLLVVGAISAVGECFNYSRRGNMLTVSFCYFLWFA